jgi:hypothetical protein
VKHITRERFSDERGEGWAYTLSDGRSFVFDFGEADLILIDDFIKAVQTLPIFKPYVDASLLAGLLSEHKQVLDAYSAGNRALGDARALALYRLCGFLYEVAGRRGNNKDGGVNSAGTRKESSVEWHKQIETRLKRLLKVRPPLSAENIGARLAPYTATKTRKAVSAGTVSKYVSIVLKKNSPQ